MKVKKELLDKATQVIFNMLKFYEVPFATAVDVVPQAVSAIIKKIKSVATSSGGKLVKPEYWGVKDFAYRVNGNTNGRYYLLMIEAAPSSIEELETYLSINDSVIRHGIFNVEKFDLSPSALCKDRGGDASEESEYSEILTTLS